MLEDDMQGSENGMTINLMHFFAPKIGGDRINCTLILYVLQPAKSIQHFYAQIQWIIVEPNFLGNLIKVFQG